MATRRYGHQTPGDPIQIVNLRVIARAGASSARGSIRPAAGAGVSRTERLAYFGPRLGRVGTPVVGRFDLDAKPRSGPLLIDEYDATTLVPPGCSAQLDELGNVLIRVEG
jgi:N-methylhydantoinase A